MDELSEHARKLIDTAMGKDAAPPPDASWGAFVVRMTSTQPRSEEVVVEPAPKPKRAWWPIVVGVVVIAVVAVWFLTPVGSPKVEPSVPSTTTPGKPVRDEAPVPSTGRPRPDTAKAAAPEPEVATLIRDAEAALAAKDPARALALLETHAERAPLADAERRMSLRVLVLCALDRADAAKAEARAFLDTHPRSRWADDVRRSCAKP